jgi:transposase InsO family protein
VRFTKRHSLREFINANRNQPGVRLAGATPRFWSTVLDDFSRYIVAWKLCTSMRAEAP